MRPRMSVRAIMAILAIPALLSACATSTMPPPPARFAVTSPLAGDDEAAKLLSLLRDMGFDARTAPATASGEQVVHASLAGPAAAALAACPTLYTRPMDDDVQRFDFSHAERVTISLEAAIRPTSTGTTTGFDLHYTGNYTNRFINHKFTHPCNGTGELEQRLGAPVHDLQVK